MSVPMTHNQFLAQANKWGLKLETTRHPDWFRRNRDSVRAFGPVHGVVIHHTGSTTQLSMVDYCYRGDPERGLGGPLALGVITDDGLVHMVGWGRANTQGAGDGKVLEAMKAGRVPPFPPGPDTADGNSCFYGWEFCSAGQYDPFTPAQFDAAVRLCCALLDFHGWAVQSSIIGHFQWTRRKTGDPDDRPTADSSGESLDWPVFLAAVKARLTAGHTTDTTTEDDMPTQQQVQDAVEGGIREYLKDFYGTSGTGQAMWNTQRAILDEGVKQTAALERIAVALEAVAGSK